VVGRFFRIDADAMARAFGLAGSQAAGTFAAWGTPTVKFHQCRGALSGLMAALLAEQQFIATREFLTAPDGGLYHSYASVSHPDRAVADLGNRWELEQIALRLWPGASSIQGMITAMFDIVEKYRIEPAEVKTLRIALSQPVFDLHGNFARYKAKFEAMLSAHYVAAAIVHDHALTLAQFNQARYDDPKLRRFAERVEVRAASDLSGVAAVVDVETLNGHSCSAQCAEPLGAPDNRLSRAQIEAKFKTYAADRLLQSRIEDIIAAVVRLEDQASLRTLSDMLRAVPQASDTAAAPVTVRVHG